MELQFTHSRTQLAIHRSHAPSALISTVAASGGSGEYKERSTFGAIDQLHAILSTFIANLICDDLSMGRIVERPALIAVREKKKSMCRNIRTLFIFDPPVTPEEIRAASITFRSFLLLFLPEWTAQIGSILLHDQRRLVTSAPSAHW
jgi:hypothetical protein